VEHDAGLADGGVAGLISAHDGFKDAIPVEGMGGNAQVTQRVVVNCRL